MQKFLFIIFTCCIFIGQAQSDSLMGPHKGRMQRYQNYRVEMVGCNDYLEIYFYGKNMDPLNNRFGITGDVKFYMPGETYTSSQLVEYGADGFTARISSPDYTYCRVTAMINGQPLSVKFNNECTAPVGKK